MGLFSAQSVEEALVDIAIFYIGPQDPQNFAFASGVFLAVECDAERTVSSRHDTDVIPIEISADPPTFAVFEEVVPRFHRELGNLRENSRVVVVKIANHFICSEVVRHVCRKRGTSTAVGLNVNSVSRRTGPAIQYFVWKIAYFFSKISKNLPPTFPSLMIMPRS